MLCLGGFGAVVAGTGPGDALYGLRTMLFGEQKTRDDAVILAAQTEMAQVQQLIEQGDWQAAQARLETVTTTVASVNDLERKEELVTQWQELTLKVEAQDAAATVAPGAPLPTFPDVPAVDFDPATLPNLTLEPPIVLETETTVPPETTATARGHFSGGGHFADGRLPRLRRRLGTSAPSVTTGNFRDYFGDDRVLPRLRRRRRRLLRHLQSASSSAVTTSATPSASPTTTRVTCRRARLTTIDVVAQSSRELGGGWRSIVPDLGGGSHVVAGCGGTVAHGNLGAHGYAGAHGYLGAATAGAGINACTTQASTPAPVPTTTTLIEVHHELPKRLTGRVVTSPGSRELRSQRYPSDSDVASLSEASA